MGWTKLEEWREMLEGRKEYVGEGRKYTGEKGGNILEEGRENVGEDERMCLRKGGSI
jgi:hypothetical protein